MDDPTADQPRPGAPGDESTDRPEAPVDAPATPEALFDAPEAAAGPPEAVETPPAEAEPPAPPDVPEAAAAPAAVVDTPAVQNAPEAPQAAPEPASDAPVPVEPPDGPPADTQPTLLDSSDVEVVVTAVPPAAAAKATDLTGATNVATYGDRDLDEMVAELAGTAPAAAATAAEEAEVGEAAVPAEGETGEAEGEEAAPAGDEAASSEEEGASESVSAPWWPFLVYAGVWAAYAVGLALVMKPAALGGSLFASPYYFAFLWGGLALAILGPILVLVVWLVARRGYAKGHRGGLFSSSLLKGSLALFVGVVLWWAAYYAAVWLAASGR